MIDLFRWPFWQVVNSSRCQLCSLRTNQCATQTSWQSKWCMSTRITSSFVCGLDFYLLGLDDSSCQPFVSCKCHQCLSHGFFPLHDYGFSNPSLWPICGGVIVDTLTAHFVNGRFSLDLHVNSLDIHLPNHLAPFHRFVLTNLVAQGWQLSSILSYLIDE